MYPFAVGWVWTDDASAPVSGPKLMPLLGVGSWFLAVVLKASMLGYFWTVSTSVQKFRH